MRNSISSRLSRVLGRVTDRREILSPLPALLRPVISQALFAVVLVILLQILEHTIAAPANWLIEALRSVDPLRDTVSFLRNIGALPPQMRPDPASYGVLLAALASLGGAFLALYFTILGVVTSSRYAQVPSEVRDLVVREQTGTLYVKIVALLPAVATLLLGALAL